MKKLIYSILVISLLFVGCSKKEVNSSVQKKETQEINLENVVADASNFVNCGYFITESYEGPEVNIILCESNYDFEKNCANQDNENYSCLFFGYPAEKLESGTYKGFFEGLQIVNGKRVNFKIKQPVVITVEENQIVVDTYVNLYKGSSLSENLMSVHYEGNFEETKFDSFWK